VSLYGEQIDADALDPLQQLATELRELEDLGARAIAAQRNREETFRRIAAGAVHAQGWTDAAFDLTAAFGKDRAAAEASFSAAVDLREALERLLAELAEPLPEDR
jgi:hypothetical protein